MIFDPLWTFSILARVHASAFYCDPFAGRLWHIELKQATDQSATQRKSMPRNWVTPMGWVQIIRFSVEWRTITIKSSLLWWNLVVPKEYNSYVRDTDHHKHCYWQWMIIKIMTTSVITVTGWYFLLNGTLSLKPSLWKKKKIHVSHNLWNETIILQIINKPTLHNVISHI